MKIVSRTYISAPTKSRGTLTVVAARRNGEADYRKEAEQLRRFLSGRLFCQMTLAHLKQMLPNFPK